MANDYQKSKCPNCGAELKFLPGTNSLKCENCSSIFKITSLGQGTLDEDEKDYLKYLENLNSNQTDKIETKKIRCQDCGGEITFKSNEVSTDCPFCGSHRVIIEDNQKNVLKIDGVIPFKLDKKDVNEKFLLWIKKRKFAPSGLKKGIIQYNITSFYFPYYTFDANTYSTYTAERGDYYYETREVKDANGTHTETVRKTRWTFVSGTVKKFFNDLLVCGTNNVLNDLIRKISYYDLTKMEKYQESFLLGYKADRASISVKEGFSDAKDIMYNTIHNICVSDIGGDTYRCLNIKTKYNDITFKQIMAPVYNGYYTFNNKKYNFVCNGQTGTINGKAPVSAFKIILFALFIAAIIYGICMLSKYYGSRL